MVFLLNEWRERRFRSYPGAADLELGGVLPRYEHVQQEPEKREESFLPREESLLESEIDPITCAAFVLIVFIIVPFTLLSPFRYPERSTLDRLLAVNVERTDMAATRAPFLADRLSSEQRRADASEPVSLQ